MYEIRTFQKEYLEKQFEIGNKILSEWPGTGQTSVENLTHLYSGVNFDPETKFYAFQDDEMVGFQTATIKPRKEGDEITRANLEFPLVKSGHEAAIDALMKFSFKKLKEKGVSKVQSRGCQLWGETMKMVEKYEYEYKRTLNLSGTITVSEFQVEDHAQVRAYNEETDYDSMRKMYLEVMKLSEKQLDNQLKFLKDNPHVVVSWNVVIQDGEILGNTIVTYLGGDQTKGIMANIFAQGDDEKNVRKQLLHANIESCKAKGVEELNIILFGQYLEKQKEYENLGIVFNAPLDLYHRDI